MIQDYVRQLGQVGGMQPQVSYVPTEADYSVLTRKNREKELVAFDAFVSRYLDPTRDPAIAQYLKQIYPEFIDRRLKEIDSKLEIQRKLAQIKIKGTPDKEDLLFLFTLEQLALDQNLPWQQFDEWLRAPVFDPNPPGVSSTFSRGLLNARKWLGYANVPMVSGTLFGGTGELLGNMPGPRMNTQLGINNRLSGSRASSGAFINDILNNRR